MRIVNIFTTILLVLSLSACKAQKSVTTPGADVNHGGTIVTTDTDQAAWLSAMTTTIGGWSTLKSGGHLTVKGAGKSFSSAMQVRMVRDEAIFISLRPLLGIEAGRLVIRGDSLFVINKLQKLYMAEKVSLLTAGVPATVGMMQDLFLGRAHLMGEGTLNASRASMVEVVTEGSKLLVTPKSQPRDFSYAFAYDADKHILSLDVKLAKGDNAYAITYGDVQRTLAGNIAHSIKFNTDVKGKSVGLEMDYDRISWNEDVDLSFNIPSGYKRQDARALMNLF